MVSEIRTIERGTDPAKKEAKEQIPADRVKDPAALARELRWRVRVAAGYGSDDEGFMPKMAAANGNKRKRAQPEGANDQAAKFKNFKPRLWEAVFEVAGETEKKVVKMSKPDGDEWKDKWVAWKDEMVSEEAESEADVRQKRDVIVKVRKTATGVERQRVERIMEEWIWSDVPPTILPREHSSEESKMEVDVAALAVGEAPM